MAQTDMFSFDAAQEAARVRRYFSGVLSPAIWQGYIEARVPVCVAATDMGPAALERVVAHAAAGGELLIDNGAYRYRAQPENMPWNWVIRCYEEILAASTMPQTVILPDVVGDQTGTLAVLGEHGHAVLALCQGMHTALLPVQRGPRSLPAFLAAAREVLGRWPDGIAVPSAAAALDPRELGRLGEVDAGLPRRVHVLGVSRHTQRLMERLVHLREAWPDAEVSRDACEHRAQVGQGRQITEARKAHLVSLVDDEVTTWDETEESRVDLDGWARTMLGEVADDHPEMVDDLVCSDWGRMLELQAAHKDFGQRCGPRATTRSIREFAEAAVATDEGDIGDDLAA